MLKASEIIGYQIICLDTKKKEGEIKDIILDLEKAKIFAFIVDNGTIIHKTRVIEFNKIYSVENHIITLKHEENLKKISNYGKKKKKLLKENQNITGAEVITKSGELLGFVQDILFHKDSGNILGLVLTNGIIDDMLNGIKILPVEKPINMVEDKLITSNKIKDSILQNIGGLKKLLELEQ